MKLLPLLAFTVTSTFLTACLSGTDTNSSQQSNATITTTPQVIQPETVDDSIVQVTTPPLVVLTPPPSEVEVEVEVEGEVEGEGEGEGETTSGVNNETETTETVDEGNTTPEEEGSTAPEEEVIDTPAQQVEILPWLRVPMHYEILLGQSQIWGETGGTLALSLSQDAAIESTTLELTSSNNLVPQQLISYRGEDNEYYRAQIQSIDGNQVLLTTPLKQSIAAGANAWNFYEDGSHPNPYGYRVIADYAARLLDKEQLNEGMHVFLGDSWFEDGLIADRLKIHLPAATFVNRGMGGNTSTDLVARFDADVLPYNPNFVWIIAGTNDYWQNVTAETYKANIETLVAKIKAINAVPVVIDSSVGPLNFGTDTITQLSHSYVTVIDQLLAED